MLRDVQDVFSVRFTIANGTVTALSHIPTLLTLELDSADSGGALILQLNLNMVCESARGCVRAGVCVLDWDYWDGLSLLLGETPYGGNEVMNETFGVVLFLENHQ